MRVCITVRGMTCTNLRCMAGGFNGVGSVKAVGVKGHVGEVASYDGRQGSYVLLQRKRSRQSMLTVFTFNSCEPIRRPQNQLGMHAYCK